MSFKVVHFLAASDRINYGDLLFPILFMKVAEKELLDFQIYNYGLIKSNLTFFGGLPTKSYKDLHLNLKKDGGTIVIGGGDVFFANWETLYSYVNPMYSWFMKFKLLRKVNSRFKITDRVLHTRGVLLPFTPGAFEFNTSHHIQVIYNAVGGTFRDYSKSIFNVKVLERLLSSSYISVRDKRTRDSLMMFGVESVIYPDSAIIMSDFYPIKLLERKTTLDIDRIPDNYFFIQFGLNKSPKNFKETALKIEKLIKEHKVKAILCPIGIAPKHEDHVELKKMAKYSENFEFIMPKNIYDIMWLIANSKAYLGTSLHGALTAQSYNVAFFPLNKKIIKADSYFKTWCPNVSIGCVDFENLEQINGLLNNWDYKQAKNYLNEQKSLVYKNFDTIFKKIKSNEQHAPN